MASTEECVLFVATWRLSLRRVLVREVKCIAKYNEFYKCNDGSAGYNVFLDGVKVGEIRSEERRVGKECRSRWSPDH